MHQLEIRVEGIPFLVHVEHGVVQGVWSEDHFAHFEGTPEVSSVEIDMEGSPELAHVADFAERYEDEILWALRVAGTEPEPEEGVT